MNSKISSRVQEQMNALANDKPISTILLYDMAKIGSLASARAAVLSVASLAPSENRRTFELLPAEAIKVTAAEIEALSQQEHVAKILSDLPLQFCLNSSVTKIYAHRVWAETGFKGLGIKVAVVDSGIDSTHPDFSGRIGASRSFVSASARDDHGHGTHVAGIIAGNGAKSGGKFVGVAPEAELIIAKVMRADGSGEMSVAMAAIEWAILEQHAQIINLSIAGPRPCDGTDALSTLVDEAVRQAGVVICTGAGNDGPKQKTIPSPGCARLAITVGAIDHNDQVAAFSSRGPTTDGRRKPDIVYPGVSIIAPRAAGTRIGAVIDERYVACSGTSMATSHASGVAALMLQANPNLTAAQVKTLMLAGAVNIGALPNEQGVGRGDAYLACQKAIEAVTSEPQTPLELEPELQPQPENRGCLGIFGRWK